MVTLYPNEGVPRFEGGYITNVICSTLCHLLGSSNLDNLGRLTEDSLAEGFVSRIRPQVL